MASPVQVKFRQRTYELKFKRGFMLFCAVIIVLCCFLGKWQVQRYHYKQQLLQAYARNQQTAAVPVTEISRAAPAMQFQPVTAAGTYENADTVLLTNRPYHDRIGFEVLTPLRIAGEKKMLWVDRGWVAADAKQNAPVIQPVIAPQQIKGVIKFLNEFQFILGNNVLAAGPPRQLQKMDIAALEKLTGQTYFPFIVRLDPRAENGFGRDWIISTVQPERHLGYAVQWFALAAALLIAAFCFCCEALPEK
jgi:surfeit locus 1 family protein